MSITGRGAEVLRGVRAYTNPEGLCAVGRKKNRELACGAETLSPRGAIERGADGNAR